MGDRITSGSITEEAHRINIATGYAEASGLLRKPLADIPSGNFAAGALDDELCRVDRMRGRRAAK